MRLIPLYIILTLCIACQRVDIKDQHNHQGDLELKLDVRTQEAGISDPKSTSYIFYSKTDNSLINGKIPGSHGKINIPAGVYDLLIYTSDFNQEDAIFYRGLDNVNTSEAHTRQSAYVESARLMTKSHPRYKINDPDPLFSKLLKGIEITNLTQQTIDEQLEQRSYKYWLTIQVEGLQYVHSAYMQLEGWYTSVYLVDGVHKEEEEAIHTVEMSFNEAKGNIYGEYWSFGPHQSQEIKNRMVLTFVNGKSQVIELKDMSAHIKSLKTGGEIVITQKIVITGDDKNDTGFIPSIVDWEDIEIEKPI